MSQSPQTGQVYFNKLRLSMENSLFQKKSQSPQTGQVYFNNYQCTLRLINCILSQSPQTGQVYFNFIQHWHKPIANVKKVSIPQTGQVYFNSGRFYTGRGCCKSQSPQTGQVYFNRSQTLAWYNTIRRKSLNPLKRVKFISIVESGNELHSPVRVSIPSNGSSLFQWYREGASWKNDYSY